MTQLEKTMEKLSDEYLNGNNFSEEFETKLKDFLRDSHIKEWEEIKKDMEDELENVIHQVKKKGVIDTKATGWAMEGRKWALEVEIEKLQEKINNAKKN